MQGKTLGIVGVGSIGSCLRDKLSQLGMTLLLCDPPKHEAGELPNHTDLDTLLANADIVSFHVPLVKHGPHKTLHMLDKARLSALKPGMTIINASRGDVIDNQALLDVFEQGAKLDCVLDVWENEPTILTPLLDYVRFASVHIAGHTQEGKARGTQMLYQKVCELEGVAALKSLEDFLPEPICHAVTLGETFCLDDIGRLVHLIYDVRRDDGILRSKLSSEGFDSLRKNYPPRREFNTLSVAANSACEATLAALGFRINE